MSEQRQAPVGERVRAIWVDFYFGVVFADGLLSLAEEMLTGWPPWKDKQVWVWCVGFCFRVDFTDGLLSLAKGILTGPPTWVMSAVALLISLPMLAQSLRRKARPAALLSATAGMEIAAFVMPFVFFLARLPVRIADQLMGVPTYLPMSLLAYAGLARGEPRGRPTLARVSLLWAVASATLVGFFFQEGGYLYAVTDIMGWTAFGGGGLGLVALLAERNSRQRLYALTGCLFNFVVAYGWANFRL